MILDDRVAADRGTVGDHDAIRHLHVMAGVGGIHEEVVVADAGRLRLMDRAVHRGVLAEHVVVADHRSRPVHLRVEVQGLRGDPDRAERPEVVAFADHQRSLQEAVATKSRARADPDAAFEHAVRADLDVVGEFDPRVHDGCGMDPGHGV